MKEVKDMGLFKGSGVALVTPFINNLVNYEKLGELIDWHIENLTDAIIVCGTTGESSTLTKGEKKGIILFAVERAAGRVPIIAGTGSNNTIEAIEMSKFAESAGVDGLLIVTPYYNKTSQVGMLQHYLAIAEEVHIPIILYNVPGRTGLNLLPETVAKLAEHPIIQGIKEASGDMTQVADLARICPTDFFIYSGNDDQIVPLLSLGGHGVIFVVANILPKETHNIVMDYLGGNIEKARSEQLRLLNLIHALFIEPNPIPIKSGMNLMGMDVGGLRLPLTGLEPKNEEKLVKNLQELGIDTVVLGLEEVV